MSGAIQTKIWATSFPPGYVLGLCGTSRLVIGIENNQPEEACQQDRGVHRIWLPEFWLSRASPLNTFRDIGKQIHIAG